MIHKVCLDLLGRLIKAEGECCALEDFSRLRELLLLLCPIFFVSPSVFLPGACSVPLWAKPRSLVGAWATWACFFTALSLLGDTASVLSSAVSLLYFEKAPLSSSLWWPLECFHRGSATNLPTWHQSMNVFLYCCKQKKWHNFLGCLPSYFELM